MYLELVVGHTDVRPAPRGSESKNGGGEGMGESDEQLRTTESDCSHYASEPVRIHSFILQIPLDQLCIPDVVRHYGIKRKQDRQGFHP